MSWIKHVIASLTGKRPKPSYPWLKPAAKRNKQFPTLKPLPTPVGRDVFVVHYVTLAGEQFIWRYFREDRQEVFVQVGLMAVNKDVAFDWHDAAAVCAMVRNMELQASGLHIEG